LGFLDRRSDAGWHLPVLSGLLLVASYYLPTVVLNAVSFLPLLIWVDRRLAGDRPRLFLGGFVFGMVTYFGGMHFWAATMEITWLAGLLWLLFAVAMALRAGLIVWLLGRLRLSTGLSFALLLPLCWIPAEWVSTIGDLRMTGDHLAYNLTQYPFLIQFADLVGHYGVGALVVIVNGLLYESLTAVERPRRRRAIFALVGLLAAVLGYDAWCWTRPDPPRDTVRVALVQPNIPLSVKREGKTPAEQWQTLETLTRRAAEEGAEIVVWPESSHPFGLTHWLNRPETYGLPRVQFLARQLDVTLLIGVEYTRVESVESYASFNAAMVVDPTGTLSTEWGAKVYLVPFAEGLPFRPLLGPLVEGREGEAWRWIDGGFRPGPTTALLDAAGTKVGVLVCFEQLFPDLPRKLRNAGAELQVVITNDAWWGRMPFQRYQANALRLRAIESRTEFVRVANTGISGFVDTRGRYHLRTGLFEEAVEIRDVHPTTTRTVYNVFGDAVAWIALIGLAVVIFVARARLR
jgi:apolipoprotein N-acyltransferase